MFKEIAKWLGITISVLCGLALLSAFIGVLPAAHSVYFHQSGIRWLAEGTVAGLILSAIGFWEND